VKIGTSSIDFKGLQIDGPMGLQSIEPKIMKLLRVLTENAGEVMTREELISAVWGVEYGGDESLSRGISILRKVLGDKKGDHRHIVTVSRVGYRLIADIDSNYKSKSFVQRAQDSGGVELSDNDGLKIPTSKLKKMPAIVGLMTTLMALAFVVLLGGRAKETLSLQARIEQGYSHIENFTRKGAITEAQDIFSGILADDPSHAAARAGLAFAIFREYTHLERDPALLQRAKAHAEAALREDEHLALANIAVAWAAEYEGDFDRAHEHLDVADILDAENIFALEGRYRAFIGQGQFEKVASTIKTSIQAYPDYALFYAYRGAYFSDIEGDFSEAEIAYRKAIELAPDNPRTYAELAHSLHSQDRTDEAVAVIQEGLRVSETSLLYNNLGTYLFFQGQYSLATTAFEKTLELDGNTHNYLYWANLGDAYRWSQGKKDEAASSYRRALQLLQVDLDLYPNRVNLISRAAMFNAKLGNLDEARDYMGAISLTPDSPSIQLYRAVVTYEILSERHDRNFK